MSNAATILRGEAVEVAPKLLGWELVRRLDIGGEAAELRGRIVEVEAYPGGEDRGSHSFAGRRTARNDSMFGPPGTAYVYFTYGMHFCFNIATGGDGEGQAVLVRALEPLAGQPVMRRLRAAASGREREELRETDLCSGPAKLCQAMLIDRSVDGWNLLSQTSDLRVVVGSSGRSREMGNGPRVGLGDSAGSWRDRPWRWWDAGSAHVSGRR
jgi:DNA-3-methyladenine glycosylase